MSRTPYRSQVLSCFVRTRFKTHNKSCFFPGSCSPSSGRSIERLSGVSKARTGEMVLKGVWFKKNIVQSSRCVSAPSGNIDMARILSNHSTRKHQGFPPDSKHTSHPLPVVGGIGTLAEPLHRYGTRQAERRNSGCHCPWNWWFTVEKERRVMYKSRLGRSDALWMYAARDCHSRQGVVVDRM